MKAYKPNYVNKIKYTDNINIYNTPSGRHHIKHFDINLLNTQYITTIKQFNEIKLECKPIQHLYKTTYSCNHLKNQCCASYDNFLTSSSGSVYNDKTDKYIESGVLFSSYFGANHIITHSILDYSPSLNIFYDYLMSDKSIVIIIEFIPFDIFTHNIPNNYNKNTFTNTQSILTKFFRDIGIQNEIIYISHCMYYNTVNADSLFINNLLACKYPEKVNKFTNLRIIHMLSHQNNRYFSQLMSNIISLNEPPLFILEKRTNNTLFNLRNINNNIYKAIHKKCSVYCNKHKYKLFIWDSDKIKLLPLYEQYKLGYRAKIIIGFGGSMWYFNSSMVQGKILILNTHVWPGIVNVKDNKLKEILYNILLLNYINFYVKKDIKIYMLFLAHKMLKFNYKDNIMSVVSNFLRS